MTDDEIKLFGKERYFTGLCTGFVLGMMVWTAALVLLAL